jgi:hypothetical protein
MSNFYLTDYNVKNRKFGGYFTLLQNCKKSFNYVGDADYRFRNLPSDINLFVVGRKLWIDKKYNSNKNYSKIIQSFKEKPLKLNKGE